MKLMVLMCVVSMMGMASVANAVVPEEKSAPAVAAAPATAAQAASVPGQIRHLDERMGGRESAANESLEAVEASAGMESYDTYDPNTGLPDTTPSDSVGNLN